MRCTWPTWCRHRLVVSSVLATVRRAREGLAIARPFAAPGTVFNARISDRRNLAYAELDLDDIKAVKNHFDVKVNDVVMALVSGVLRQYLMFRRPRGFRHRDADLLTQHHRDVAAGQTRHRACRLPGPRPDLWEMADEFAVGMEELLAHARLLRRRCR